LLVARRELLPGSYCFQFPVEKDMIATPRSDLKSDSDKLHQEKESLLARILNNPKLPSPPSVALQIVQKTRVPECTVEEIAGLLALDSAICGKVLKTLNSALYALSQPVSSLKRAVTILGLRPLRSLVLGLTLPAMESGLGSDEGLRRYWRDSVAGAILTQELAKRLRYPAPEDDLVASLLRDLGMLLLRYTFRDTYDPWLGSQQCRDEDQCEWEERNLGVHHAEVGAALLTNWGLPREIVEPIRFHHHPHLLIEPAAMGPQRAHLLNFTSRLARLSDSTGDAALLEEVLGTARDRYGMREPELETLLGRVHSTVEEFAAILKVDIGDCPDFAEALAAGREELTRLSAESADEPLPAQALRAERAKPADMPADLEDASVTAVLRRPGTVTVSDLSEAFFARLRDVKSEAQIQRYELSEWIGRGAMGVVVKAYDRNHNREVALKFLAPELAREPASRTRFSLEARFAAAVRSDHVVATYAVSELDGNPFLVMEYVRGKSLGHRLANGETFTVSEIARIARHAALGLAAAHDMLLIHRDIKPDNILLEDGSARALIADFGLVRAVEQDFQISQPGQLMGTPLFMSPEQVDGNPLTPASDLFSLGSVLYVLCTGQLPFRAKRISELLDAIVLRNPIPVHELNQKIPDWLAKLVERLHAKKPEDRVSSAWAVAEYCKPRADE
jgi:eukaryotic-like serine/threonine-protein kinase